MTFTLCHFLNDATFDYLKKKKNKQTNNQLSYYLPFALKAFTTGSFISCYDTLRLPDRIPLEVITK
jgi:hypothetical protein